MNCKIINEPWTMTVQFYQRINLDIFYRFDRICFRKQPQLRFFVTIYSFRIPFSESFQSKVLIFAYLV